jgi:UDP-2-acetamido-2,6-beta-L-arabino-hexul-4-ose reductase
MSRSVVVTGSRGFIGRNVMVRLRERGDTNLLEVTRDTSEAELDAIVDRADVIIHLAGVNRPHRVEEYGQGNAEFTARLARRVSVSARRPQVIFASSIQVQQDNPYGRSKFAAERALRDVARDGKATVCIYRLGNVFGKWCRPDYNSVVATFCHNIAHDLPITISDADRPVELVYIDDVVAALTAALDHAPPVDADHVVSESIPCTTITLGELAERIRSFRGMRDTHLVPDLSRRFDQQLYATYLSYLDPRSLGYSLERRSDERGDLAEFIRSVHSGQVFISRTRPGVTRGNHYHHTKTEKFLVVEGEAVIRLRHVEGGEPVELPVRGEDYRVVDVPPGYTHSITNIGGGDLVTVFWASELFDPGRPDTVVMPVHTPEPTGGLR